jgi:hypothetical protein
VLGQSAVCVVLVSQERALCLCFLALCRDQSTPDNPPLLLPCNHVLCEQSVLRIAKSRTRVFKCPYCPVEARADNLRPLVFPPPRDMDVTLTALPGAGGEGQGGGPGVDPCHAL